MDLEVILALGAILIYVILIFTVLCAFIIAAGFIATYLNLTGVMWWAVALVSFLVLSGLAGGISISIKGE